MHKQLNELVGTRAANLLNEEMEVERKFPADQTEELKKIDSCYSILIDAEITREIIEEVEESVEYVIGMDRAGNAASSDCEILTRKQLEQMVPEAEK